MEISEKIKRKEFYYDRSFDTESSVSTRLHYHENYEIYFLENGSCEYLIKSRRHILKEGDLILVAKGVEHSTDYKNKTHTRRLINCSEKYIPSVLIDLFSENVVFRDESLSPKISRIFDLIEEEYQKNELYGDEIIRCLVESLCYIIARIKEKNLVFVKDMGAVDRAVRYIDENYMNEVTLREVASYIAISAEHLSRLFKKEMGVCFNEYLNSVRLKKAEYMLINEEGKSVFEIAYSCGFSDSNYFSYKFKKAYGVSPRSLRSK